MESNQRLCVAALIGHCEAIAESGQLSEPAEESLRLLIAETLSAFGMNHHEHIGHSIRDRIKVLVCQERRNIAR
jgi:hypothetical protein